MLRLTATDQSITMTTSAAGSIDYISDWTDIVNATAVTTAGSEQGNVTTATTTTIIAAPASGSSRAVRSAIISNRHDSTSNTIQLFKTVGAASYAISKPLVLLPGETVRFSDEGSCFVGNACESEAPSTTTAKQLESNATTGVMQIVGPAAGTTRVVTIPDADATMARTDEAQAFTGNQTFHGRVLIGDTTEATTTADGSLQTDGGLSVVKNAVIGGTLNSGPASIIGTTATDGPTFSAELLTSSGWTSNGWTGDFDTGFTHIPGYGSSLTNSLAAVIGNKYQISYTITNGTSGSVTIAFGGQSIAGITATGAFGPTATTVDGLAITPTLSFNGKIVISIKQITDGSAAAYTIRDSALTIKSELRAVPGNNNTANGYRALYFNSAGYDNTANGYQALYFNTTGSGNIANGCQALYSNTTGVCNAANGYQALYSNITGYNNIANGYQALYFNTTGNNNIANGCQALYSNTTGSGNTANGYRALYSNTTGNNNTANGYQALYSNTTGYNNIANGYQALYFNTTGNNNIANGYQALYNNISGCDNIANGCKALLHNATGSSNTANGCQALYNNISGCDNTANGYRALHYNTTGYSNTANGYQALGFNTTGYNNTANGCWALNRNNYGYNNAANGYQALQNNTDGDNNTANGCQALQNNSTGCDNTANGYRAGADNYSGYQNTYIGRNTGRGITSGSNNTVLGANVTGLATTLSDNIILATGQGTIRMRFDGAKWKLNLAEVPAYANNAAAIAGGLAAGDIYRTNGDPDTLCIVH